MTSLTTAERKANEYVLQQKINAVNDEKHKLIIRLSALSDKNVMAVVHDEYLEVEKKLDDLLLQLAIMQTMPVCDNDIQTDSVNQTVESKEDVHNFHDVDNDWNNMEVDEDEWIIRDPMDPYKDTFKVVHDIITAIEITNKIELKKILTYNRVRIPTSLQDKRAWIHVTTLLHKKITLYSVDEHTLDTIGLDNLSELSLYVYVTHDVWESTSNKSAFLPCIKTANP